MAILHQSATQLQHKFSQVTSRQANAAPTAETLLNQAGSRGKGQKPTFIRPRSLESLHLTFFFGGEVLCALSEDELTAWHSSVEHQLGACGFRLATTAVQQTDESQGSEMMLSYEQTYWLRIKEFRLFPPRRNYLVVAVLEASPAWHELYRSIREIAKSSPCPALVEITKASKDVWIPHVTLANIEGRGTAEEMKSLQNMLEELSQPLAASDGSPVALPTSIGMGGPVPDAASLDWDFVPSGLTETIAASHQSATDASLVHDIQDDDSPN